MAYTYISGDQKQHISYQNHIKIWHFLDHFDYFKWLNSLNPQSKYPKLRHHVIEITMNKLHGDCVKLLFTNKTYFT